MRKRLIEFGFKGKINPLMHVNVYSNIKGEYLDLQASFPIKEMPRTEETSNFIGMTYFHLCAEVDAETTKGKKLYQTVSQLSICCVG